MCKSLLMLGIVSAIGLQVFGQVPDSAYYRDTLFIPVVTEEDSILQGERLTLDSIEASILARSQGADEPDWRKKLNPIKKEGGKIYLRLNPPGHKPLQLGIPSLFYAGKTPPYSPRVAWKRSLLFPGWGQLYNDSYWKIPIVYGGLAGLGYIVFLNDQGYKDFRRAYRIRIQQADGLDISDEDLAFLASDDIYANSDVGGLRSRRDRLRRDRDFYVILTIGWHLLSVLDAYVDAHLKGFDVSEDITFKVRPVLIPTVEGNALAPGLGIGMPLPGQ
ncbi:MAG: DUF5683 domain-containing protein [Bacteroidota bacterium]